MTTLDFVSALMRLGISQEHLRRVLDLDKMTVNRWANGARVPNAVAYLLTACLNGRLTIAELERMHLDRYQPPQRPPKSPPAPAPLA